jgi:hypothetical protein
LQIDDVKLHAFHHLRTCTEVCGKTVKLSFNITAIHLARKLQ